MRITLVVPLLNEASSVEALLDSVLVQTRPPDKVVIVDGGSDDGTPAIVQAWAEREGRGEWIRLIDWKGATPGVGRNAGARHADGDWIAFTDGGIRLQPEWLERLSAAADPGTDMVLGSYDPVVDSLLGQCAAIAYVPALEPWGGRGAYAASVLVRKEFFEKTGGFPPHRAAEDLLFYEKAVGAGARIAHAPGAVVRWQTAPTLAATYRRFASYSFHNLLAGMGRHWHAGVLRLYLVLLAAMALALWSGAGAAATAVLPLFYLARAAKAAWQKRRSFPFSTLNPARVAGASLLLVVIDTATLAGTIRWLRDHSAR
jgi:GT2 family glycosyltransferase